MLAGRDLLASAQTGTGKTAGFTLPMLQLLTANKSGANASSHARRNPRALVLVPTRELAAQVQESVRTYGKHSKLRTTVIYGGVGFHPQVNELRRGVDIVVATPGRLLDHVQQRTIDLCQIEILVVDEADRMLDMGFIHDIRRILPLLPAQRQNLLFSATFPDEVRKLAAGFMRDPETVEAERRNSTVELISQIAHPVDKDKKRHLLAHLVKTNNWFQVLVFTKTKHGANRLAEQLTQDGIESDAIHGNKSQPQRARALKRFKDNDLQILVATDIASRGIDIDALPHVVNYDLPNVSEDYVHRIGRTGRAGSTGEAISLVSGEDRTLLRDIERLIGKKIEQKIVEGFEPSAGYHTAKPEPQPRRGGQQRQGQPRQGQPRNGQARGQNRGGQQRNGQQRSGGQARDGQERARPAFSADSGRKPFEGGRKSSDGARREGARGNGNGYGDRANGYGDRAKPGRGAQAQPGRGPRNDNPNVRSNGPWSNTSNPKLKREPWSDKEQQAIREQQRAYHKQVADTTK